MLGFFFRVVLPLGQYDDSKLINLGSNRWQIITGLGFSHRFGRWQGDAYLGA